MESGLNGRRMSQAELQQLPTSKKLNLKVSVRVKPCEGEKAFKEDDGWNKGTITIKDARQGGSSKYGPYTSIIRAADTQNDVYHQVMSPLVK